MPHISHDATFAQFSEFLSEHPDFDGENRDAELWRVKSEGGYDAAVITLNKLTPYEPCLENETQTVNYPQFRKYLDEAVSSVAKKDSHNMVTTLIERLITKDCYNEHSWIMYCRYMSSDIQACRNLLKRAVRNVPQSGELWVKLLMCCFDGKNDRALLSRATDAVYTPIARSLE